MLRKTCGLALVLALLAGCESGEDVSDNVNSPSEGARIENQNPSTPTVDVPSTPEDEAAEAAPSESAIPATDTLTPPAADTGVEPPAADTSAGAATPPDSADNAGEKTLQDADAAVKTGGDTPKP